MVQLFKRQLFGSNGQSSFGDAIRQQASGIITNLGAGFGNNFKAFGVLPTLPPPSQGLILPAPLESNANSSRVIRELSNDTLAEGTANSTLISAKNSSSVVEDSPLARLVMLTLQKLSETNSSLPANFSSITWDNSTGPVAWQFISLNSTASASEPTRTLSLAAVTSENSSFNGSADASSGFSANSSPNSSASNIMDSAMALNFTGTVTNSSETASAEPAAALPFIAPEPISNHDNKSEANDVEILTSSNSSHNNVFVASSAGALLSNNLPLKTGSSMMNRETNISATSTSSSVLESVTAVSVKNSSDFLQNSTMETVTALNNSAPINGVPENGSLLNAADLSHVPVANFSNSGADVVAGKGSTDMSVNGTDLVLNSTVGPMATTAAATTQTTLSTSQGVTATTESPVVVVASGGAVDGVANATTTATTGDHHNATELKFFNQLNHLEVLNATIPPEWLLNATARPGATTKLVVFNLFAANLDHANETANFTTDSPLDFGHNVTDFNSTDVPVVVESSAASATAAIGGLLDTTTTITTAATKDEPLLVVVGNSNETRVIGQQFNASQLSEVNAHSRALCTGW